MWIDISAYTTPAAVTVLGSICLYLLHSWGKELKKMEGGRFSNPILRPLRGYHDKRRETTSHKRTAKGKGKEATS